MVWAYRHHSYMHLMKIHKKYMDLSFINTLLVQLSNTIVILRLLYQPHSMGSKRGSRYSRKLNTMQQWRCWTRTSLARICPGHIASQVYHKWHIIHVIIDLVFLLLKEHTHVLLIFSCCLLIQHEGITFTTTIWIFATICTILYFLFEVSWSIHSHHYLHHSYSLLVLILVHHQQFVQCGVH